MSKYEKATRPTIYFIGVTTAQSSIMKVFPEWVKILELKDACIKGMDFRLHASREEYRDAVEFIKQDALSLGALVTSHKIDLFHHCRDLFDEVDGYSGQLGEVSSISKAGGKLWAHAKDPISSGLALEHFVPRGYWKDHGGEVLLLGAGGSSLAMTVYLTQEKFKDNMPSKIIIANRSIPRLEAAALVLKNCKKQLPIEFLHTNTQIENDSVVSGLREYSLIVNATGLGKDAPGSPLSASVRFPQNSLVWEINYRGNLLFMQQALNQRIEKKLVVENGWTYFIHGWTQVIMEVFHVSIDGDTLNRLSITAKQYEGGITSDVT